MTQTPKNLIQLRDVVLEMLAKVTDDRRLAVQAHEVGNLAGKVVSMCKIHLEFSKLNEIKSKGEWSKFMAEDSKKS